MTTDKRSNHENDTYWGTDDPEVPRSGDGWLGAPEESLIQVEVAIPDFEGWIARWVFETAGVPRPIQVTIRCIAKERVGVITSKMMRQVSADRARERLIEIATKDDDLGPLFDEAFDRERVLVRPGRRGRDYFYAVIARDYVTLLRHHAPVKALADRLGFRVSTVNNWLHEARRRGLLTPSPSGMAGGDVTEKCQEVLRRGPRQ